MLEPSRENNAPESLLRVRESITLPSDMETQDDCERSDIAYPPTTRTQQFQNTLNRNISRVTFPRELGFADSCSEKTKRKKQNGIPEIS